jgi:hypothetical protein
MKARALTNFRAVDVVYRPAVARLCHSEEMRLRL